MTFKFRVKWFICICFKTLNQYEFKMSLIIVIILAGPITFSLSFLISVKVAVLRVKVPGFYSTFIISLYFCRHLLVLCLSELIFKMSSVIWKLIELAFKRKGPLIIPLCIQMLTKPSHVCWWIYLLKFNTNPVNTRRLSFYSAVLWSSTGQFRLR